MRPAILTFTLSLLVSATNAGAMTLAPVAPQAAADIVRVADGCGPGYHATPRGICRPNGERVVIEPRAVVVEPRRVIVEPRPVVVERPVVVAPRRVVVEERPVVVEPRRVVVVPRERCGIRVGPVAVGGPC